MKQDPYSAGKDEARIVYSGSSMTEVRAQLGQPFAGPVESFDRGLVLTIDLWAAGRQREKQSIR